MENKTRSRVMLAITLFSAIVLSGTVFVCARRAGEEVTQRSFDELTTATKQLAKDINNATRTDQTILSAMAELIAGQDEDDLDSVLRIMNTFSLDKTFVSTVALLRPDGTLLLTDGARYDVSGAFDFETEAARGAYISDRVTSYFAPEKLVVRNVVPVKRDGETIAILYGVVLLQELSRNYQIDLYNGNAFHSVSVCLDSGKKATAACSADVRGLERVVYVNVYDGDEPEGTCDKHVLVDYCVTGGGVATDYCHMFSDAQIESRSLVKLTQAEVDEIKAADGFGLNDIYPANYYVYLIDSEGNPASWHGFYNNLNNGVDAPYIMCPLHNQSSWEEYQPGGTEEDTTGGWDNSSDNSSDGGWHGGWHGFVG